MAMALKLQSPVQQENVLFCPLIDARRQEVYTGLYDYNLNLIKHYSAEILGNSFLHEEKNAKIIVVGGTGLLKLQEISNNKNILYINSLKLSTPAVILANKAVILKKFSDIVYSEPFYLKPVYFRNANL
jgi:tRNA threonylcarbamoyladenosine biosynthesis protein TsaB